MANLAFIVFKFQIFVVGYIQKNKPQNKAKKGNFLKYGKASYKSPGFINIIVCQKNQQT